MIIVVRSAMSPQRLVDLLLDLHVDGRGGVVEHEDRRVHDQRRDRQPPLTTGQGEPRSHHGVVALGQLLHELVGAGRARRGLVSSNVRRTAVREVVADRHREEERLVGTMPMSVAQARSVRSRCRARRLHRRR
jgi:hypothetical protein